MNKFGYAAGQSLKQISRNKGMTLASVLAITAMMLILGVFLIVVANVDRAADSIRDDYNTIEVFYPDDVTEDAIRTQAQDIEKWDNVKKVTYRSKEDALKIMKKRWGDSGYLLDSLSENPLPNSLVVTVANIEKADAVAKRAEKLEKIEDIRYYKSTVDRLVRITSSIEIAGVIIIAFLIFISIVVVANTIKLTVANRSEEIQIMKYIGATNWFVRAPFVLEGIFIGIFSALVSAALVTLIYSRVAAGIGDGVTQVLQMPMYGAGMMGGLILAVFMVIGIIVGALGSAISMRRFLNV